MNQVLFFLFIFFIFYSYPITGEINDQLALE